MIIKFSEWPRLAVTPQISSTFLLISTLSFSLVTGLFFYSEALKERSLALCPSVLPASLPNSHLLILITLLRHVGD